MEGYDVWTEASRDPEREQAALRTATAAAHLEPLWPFLSASRTRGEHEHRLAVAAERIEAIASETSLSPGEVEDMARRHFALLAESRRVTAEEEEDDGQYEIVDKRNGAKVAGPFSAEEAHDKLDETDFGVPREELAIVKVQEGDERAQDDDEDEGTEKEASRKTSREFPQGYQSEPAPGQLAHPGQVFMHMVHAHRHDPSDLRGMDDRTLRAIHASEECPTGKIAKSEGDPKDAHYHYATDGPPGKRTAPPCYCDTPSKPERPKGKTGGRGGSPSAPVGARAAQPRPRRTAYSEGVNPLGWLDSMNGAPGPGERPDQHDTQYSGDGSYSEIPMGPLSGPDPAVTGWIDPQRDNNGPNDEGQVKPDDHLARRRAFRRQAAGRVPSGPGQGDAGEAPQPGQDDAGGRVPASPGQGDEPPAPQPGQSPMDPLARQVPLTTRPHQAPGGGPAQPPPPPVQPVLPVVVGDAGSTADATHSPDPEGTGDPVADAVTKAAAIIHRYNPGMPRGEIRRVATKMAGRYFAAAPQRRQAYDSGPFNDNPQGGNGGGGSSHFIPRPGGGGGEEGVAEDAAEVLPELAL